MKMTLLTLYSGLLTAFITLIYFVDYCRRSDHFLFLVTCNQINVSLYVWVTSLFPSRAAIQAFVSANQMGASLQQIMDNVLLLWALTFLWGGLALTSFKRSIESHWIYIDLEQ